MISKDQLTSTLSPESIISHHGRTLFPYQCEGVRFLENSGGRALIADEMGLGKTIQALGFLALHPEMRPALIIVKSSLKVQWQMEALQWLGIEDGLCQILDDPKMPVLPGLSGYIVSFDLLRRFRKKVTKTTPSGSEITINVSSLIDDIKRCKIKTIIIDECQQIKNTESARAQEVRDLAQYVDNVIALSGTPIKNNAAEYFSILNILKPEMFPKKSQFEYNWCDSYFNGYSYKSGGLKNPDLFLAKTKNFIIRREREVVMPQLPAINRTFQFSDLSSAVEEAYLATLKQFEDEYCSENEGFEKESNLLAYLSKMRHLTGLSKVSPTISYLEDFLDETDRKIVIFTHHKDVSELLHLKLKSNDMFKDINPPLMLTSDLDSYQRQDMIDRFKDDPKNRVMIASTLASGEGLNLQFCSDCIMMERQWNPANEEQAEARFTRIGSLATSVSAVYMVAVGTIDEFFGELVERKREIVKKTLGGKSVDWDQSSLMKELGEVLITKGRQKWSY